MSETKPWSLGPDRKIRLEAIDNIPKNKPTGCYNTDDLKKNAGVTVYMKSFGMEGQGPFWFPPHSTWRWRFVAANLMLEVLHGDDILFQAPYGHVYCVCGDTTFFRDSNFR